VSALKVAAACGYEDIVELLLQNPRIDINVKDNVCHTPSYEYSQRFNSQLFNFLIPTFDQYHVEWRNTSRHSNNLR
jgi:hypothetical protein